MNRLLLTVPLYSPQISYQDYSYKMSGILKRRAALGDGEIDVIHDFEMPMLLPMLPYVFKMSGILKRRAALGDGEIDVIHDFEMPMLLPMLPYVFNVPGREAKSGIGWGVHVCRSGDGSKTLARCR